MGSPDLSRSPWLFGAGVSSSGQLAVKAANVHEALGNLEVHLRSVEEAQKETAKFCDATLTIRRRLVSAVSPTPTINRSNSLEDDDTSDPSSHPDLKAAHDLLADVFEAQYAPLASARCSCGATTAPSFNFCPRCAKATRRGAEVK